MRNRLFGTALVGAIGGVAFAVLSPGQVAVETAPKVAAEAPATPTPSPEVASPTPSPTHPEVPQIAINTPELPQNINAIMDATVEIISHDLTGETGGSAGSGTILDVGNSNIIMSAAHVTEFNNTHCGADSISYPGTDTVKMQSDYVAGVTPAERIQVYADGSDSYKVSKYNHGLDASILVPESQAIFGGRPSLKVQDKVELEPGERVFSIGYGPRPHDFDPNPLSEKQIERNPEIIPGTVLEQEGNKITFITGTKGYGMRPDSRVRPGDSGGTFIDDKGNYLGDTVATSVEESTGSELEDLYNVDLPKGTEKQEFSWAVAQVIDHSTLKALMHKTVDCTY